MTNLLSPFIKRVQVPVEPVGTAGNDLRTPVFRAPYACTLQSVNYIPTATQAGANTNTRTLNLYNRNNSTGAGAVLMATLALVAGVDLTDNVAKVITLSGTPANLEMAAGDVIEWESLHVASGIADPGGLLEINYIRAD